MSTDRDVSRIVRSWLREDAHEDADRVLDSVLDQLETTPQRRTIWFVRRFPEMNNAVRIALAAAAVVIIAFLGLRYLAPADVGGPNDPTPTPTPTRLVTPTPSPAAVQSLPPEGELEAGTYAIHVPDSPVIAEVTIGTGWASGGWYVMNPPVFSQSVSFWTVGNVYGDACDLEGSLPDPAVGPTVDDLVSALDDQANTDMSAPIDVIIGGYSGKRLQMTVPETIDCNPPLVMWVDANGNEGRSIERPFGDTVWILDVEGQRVVIVGNATDASAEATIAEVIDSVEFVIP
jgi:hypothetical protein